MKPAKRNGCEASRSAVVLAGGLSRRFGADKVYARFNGKFFSQAIAEKLSAADFKVHFSVAQPKSIPVAQPIRMIEDPLPFEGPLQALYGALLQLKAPRLLLMACDMPFIEPDLIAFLWKESEGADVTVLKFQEKIYPLPGVYSKNIIPIVKDLLDHGVRDLKSLLGGPEEKIKIISSDRWQTLDPRAKSLLNVNTQRALREVDTITF